MHRIGCKTQWAVLTSCSSPLVWEAVKDRVRRRLGLLSVSCRRMKRQLGLKQEEGRGTWKWRGGGMSVLGKIIPGSSVGAWT
jgi:hypothetical protein